MTKSSSASNSTTTTSTHSPYKNVMNSVPKSKRRKKPLTTAMLKRNIVTTTTNATMPTTISDSDSETTTLASDNKTNNNNNNHIDVSSNTPLSDAVVVKTTTTTTTAEVMNDNDINSNHHHHHHHHHQHLSSSTTTTLDHSINNNNNSSTTSTSSSKKKKNKNKNKGKAHDEFWSNTSNTEERQKIREFWLQLREDERRSLVKVEKEAVLRKMKEQQRHSCNCSVCGKKRTAIEDELEVLYDAYYEELEQYANNQQHSRNNPLAGSYPPSETMYEDDYLDTNGHFCQDEDDEDDEDEDEDYDDEDEEEMYDEEDDDDDDDDDDDVSQSDRSDLASDDGVQYNGHMTRTASFNNSIDHLNFGNSLTVKGGILTVADDLLKNDGKKFLDMMERLAERRIKKEEVNMEPTDEYYDEEEDDDDVYDDEDDEESLQDTRTEEQRMEEGRRMFQIFAARMFEQRVLAAYREKVAQERQQRLIQELEEEDRLRQERELKKQKEKERRRDKKRQLKRQKEEERLAKEAQRKAEEEKARLERERKLQLDRQKREQERQKREEEKRQKEQERVHREEEKRKRLKEEKEKAAEKERKRKEKEQKERQERQEREERERRERRFKEEKERRERELKEEMERRDREMQERKEQWEQEQKKREDEKKSSVGRASTVTGSSSSSSAVKHSSEKTIASSASTAVPLPLSQQKQQHLHHPQHPQQHPHSHPHHPIINNHPNSSSSNRLPQPPIIGESSRQQPSLLDTLMVGAPHLRADSSSSSSSPLGLDLLPPPPPPLMPSLDFMPSRDPVPTSPASQFSLGISPLGNQVEVCGTPKAAPRAIAPIGPPINGRRASSAVAGPIGSPVGLTTSRMKSGSDASADRTTIHHVAHTAVASSPASVATPGTQHSFFSNFLFGEPSRAKNPCVVPSLQPEQDNKSVKGRSDTHLDRRFSSDTQEMGWTNGWTASSLLSDDFHGRLFGDVLPDRNTMILERAKMSYVKLNEMTQILGFHTLDQLHRMMNDLYCDCPIGIQELYHVLLIRTPQNPFRCISDPQYGVIVHHQDEPQSRSVGFGMNAFPTAVSPPSTASAPGTTSSLGGQLSSLNSAHPLQQLHCNNGR